MYCPSSQVTSRLFGNCGRSLRQPVSSMAYLAKLKRIEGLCDRDLKVALSFPINKFHKKIVYGISTHIL